ncbi:hypothetical protein AB0L34_00035 [Micromonospora sp. NPDC052213]|uniref:hypothetical protein n=1 Tax=Micromonospora sp. NPDC052213 TaxID=3155812 RepID=UPI00344A82F5
MSRIGKTRAVLATVGSLGLVLAAPAAPASANASGAGATAIGANYSTQCATGRIESIAANLPIRWEPFTDSPAFTTAQKGYQYNCIPNTYALGGRYTACGVSNANGWIIIDFPDRVGYTYMTCVKDV